PVIERDYEPLSREQLTVWGDQHPAPKEADPDFERHLLRQLNDDAQKQLAAEQAAPDRFRKSYGSAWDVILDGGLAEVGELEVIDTHQSKKGSWLETTGLLRNKTYHEELPVVF